MTERTGVQGGGRPANAEELETFIEKMVEQEKVPGLSVTVVKGDRVVWKLGFGFADLSASRRATASTIYLWFSMTKIVTATAVLQLCENGHLDLDAPVDEYFRGFKIVSQPVPVTVRHLLSHSSGLANPVPIRWVRAARSPAPDGRAFVDRLLSKHRKLEFTTGERAGYSNIGYLVLGVLISEVSGMGYEEYVHDEVLAPLGVNRTGFTYPDAGGQEMATAYQSLPKVLTPLFRAAMPRGVVGPRYGGYVTFNPFYVNGPAYGGLVGSTEEAARILLLHLNEGQVDGTRLLSPGAVGMMQQIVPRGGKRDFGLGWLRPREASKRGLTFVEHLGGGAGFWNVMRLYPEESLGVVIMGNTTSYDHESLLEAIAAVDWT